MATIKTLYGAEAQAITITLNTLAASTAGAGRESNTIDNRTNLYLDALVMISIKTGAGAISSDKKVYIYAWGTVDVAGGTKPDTVTGADANITLNNAGVTQLKLIGIIEATASATVYTSEPLPVAQAFGGILPEEWGLVIINSTGTAFDTTEANFKKLYQGIQAQSV